MAEERRRPKGRSAAQSTVDEHPRPITAGAGAEQAAIPQPVDQHPRPIEAAIAEAARPTVRAAAAPPALEHECTATAITKTGSNGDEGRYKGDDGKPNYIGSYHKGLCHNDFGEVDSEAYKKLLKVLKSESGFDTIPLCLGRKLTNPQAGLATDVEGPDPKKLEILAAPRLDSAEEAAEAVELYWMALLRDVAFTDFGANATVGTAATELSGLTSFTGPKISGKVTPQTIFRGCSKGDTVGPLLSQFLLHDIPYGSLTIDQHQRTVLGEKDLGAGKADYLTQFPEWLAVQNGKPFPKPLDKLDEKARRYIRNMRDLGRYVQVDALYEAYLNACLILLGHEAPLDPGNPYLAENPADPAFKPNPNAKTQIGFGTFGGPHILSLVTEVATRALKAVWYQKWFVHRRLRPEAYGGLIEVKLAGVNGVKRNYPIDAQILNSKALADSRKKFGSNLLPMAFPEGSPTHPAYGAGHATVAGACVTILKAWFDDEAWLPGTLKPQVPNADGSALVDYAGADAGSLTIGGELNKVASNIAIGRNMAGVHWRSDYLESVRLGEKVALSILRKQRQNYHEEDWFFTLRTFDGEPVTVNRKGVFDAKGQPVKLL